MGLKPKPGAAGWCKPCAKTYNQTRHNTDCLGRGERIITRAEVRGVAHIVHFTMGNYRFTLCGKKVERLDR